MTLYARRNTAALGEYYVRHIEAVTDEDLCDASDIAAELAWRDREIERLTRERDHFQACWNAVSDIRADRDRLMKLLEIERGVVLTRGQALTRALRCFDELLDNVWPNGLPSTVDAVVEQMRHALENEKYSPDETTARRMTRAEADAMNRAFWR